MSPEKDIAIIGMAGIYPGAPDVDRFWSNILGKVDAVSDPPEKWRVSEFYDPKSTENDKTYCKKGGFIDEYTDFNPVEFGIMPGSVEGSDPEKFLALKVARRVLEDAGYVRRAFDRKRTAVILGHGNYVNRGMGTAFYHTMVINQVLDILKTLHPETTENDIQLIRRELKAGLPPLKAETCPGLISNLLSGMVANRLDLQGPNFVIDAACASSLIALDLGACKLLSRECDMAIVGGVQAYTSIPVFVVFSLLGALSRQGKIRPFDKDADGTILGEGVGMMVIKRRVDAERDGDRIYALLKGIGTSSDGKAQGALVPRLEGEFLALERSYQNAQINPWSIGLIEAHGTATKVGDATEIEALSRLFGNRNGDFPDCALGSVKSMISHTIPASGMASLIKSTLSLYHGVLPPTLCDTPNPELGLGKTPFYLNTETRPWIHGENHPRRAGVSAFGFGGINAHAILEEYQENNNIEKKPFSFKWDSEVIVIQAESRADLINRTNCLLRFASENNETDIKDIAYTLNSGLRASLPSRLSVVAGSIADLVKKLGFALHRLNDPACKEIKDRSGIFYFDKPLGREGKLAFIFPGEGAQYANMLSDLCIHFPEVRKWFDRAEGVFQKRSIKPSLRQVLFPAPHQPSHTRALAEKALWSMEYAVMSVWAANLAMTTLLGRLGIRPDAVAGHSIGQDVALWASGIVGGEDETVLENYFENSILDKADEKGIPEARLMTVGGMDPSALHALAEESKGQIFVAMDNCPNQVVLCGPEGAIQKTYEDLVSRGAICAFLPFDRGYHTPWYRPLCEFIENKVERINVQKPRIKAFSCTTAEPFPDDLKGIRRIIVDQWALPVRFRETIEAMHDSGIRIFLEAGPRGNLTSFVEDTLRNRQYLAVPSNLSSRSSISQINMMSGLLAAHFVPMELDYLYKNRGARGLSIHGLTGEKVPVQAGEAKKSPAGMKLELVVPHLGLSEKIHEALSGNKKSPSAPDGTQRPVRRTLRSLSRIFWTSPIDQLGSPARLASCLCVEGKGFQPQVDARRILSQREMEIWNSLTWQESRRRQWLLGRMAAKDAVRYFLKDRFNLDTRPGDISVLNDKNGRPYIAGEIIKNIDCPISLSIAHSGKVSASVAGGGLNGIGIDIEYVSSNHNGLEEAGFSPSERVLLNNIGPSDRKEWLLRLWCAKEAMAKAVGEGLMGSPLNVLIEVFDSGTGTVTLRAEGELARKRPDLAKKAVTVRSGRDDILVFAIALV